MFFSILVEIFTDVIVLALIFTAIIAVGIVGWFLIGYALDCFDDFKARWCAKK